jgi:hypothetical protein
MQSSSVLHGIPRIKHGAELQFVLLISIKLQLTALVPFLAYPA